MAAERVLVLAGTTEARDLANALVAVGVDVISSFAGVTQEPLLPVGRIVRGGFGGADGLVAFLRQERVKQVVDATHPFAAQMSSHAHAACASAGVALLRLERAPWAAQESDRWIHANDMAGAAARVPHGARVLVTTGRKGLQQLFARGDLSGVVRTIEPPDGALPAQWSLLQDRPPHALADELQLLQREGITCVMSKNAGGTATMAKVLAARQLGLPLVMISRPFKPPCTTVASVAEALLGITGRAG